MSKDKNNTFFVIILCILIFIGIHTQAGFCDTRQEKYDQDKCFAELWSDKKIADDLKGGYYLAYSPNLFPESDDMRQGRDRYMAWRFFLRLKDYGLFPEIAEKAKYKFIYHYFTVPNPDGTFRHTFDLHVHEREGEEFAPGVIWQGSVSIKEATSSDISAYLSSFMTIIFNGFPESQDTRRDSHGQNVRP